MLKFLKITFAVFGGLFLLFASAQALSASGSMRRSALPPTQLPLSPTPVSIVKAPNIDDLPLQDNQNVYQYDDPDSIVTIYVTVRVGSSTDNTNHTWQEVNDYAKYANGLPVYNIVVGQADAIVQFGDDKGPLPGELGYGAVLPNATIQIRGASTSVAKQKSYKIELKADAGMWRGQSTINLNKHPYEDTRLRNKLNFDLLKQIPNITSLRTQFVHLYVKDETVTPGSTAFVDYGLFTQVEQPNKKFLKNHLLDPDGQLYKATFFEFFRYPDQLRLENDPLYDYKTFSPILEVKGNTDHSKLLQMLNDVNNYDIPIDQTFEKYFNADNFFTWMAYNILVGNIDTQSQNFYLYSPHNGNKWYVMPWDYDNANPLQGHEAEFNDLIPYRTWENGISNYWGMVLPNRLLRLKPYRQALDEKVNQLKAFMTPGRLKSMIDGYKAVIDPYVSRLPDVQNLSGTLQARDAEIALIPSDIQINYDLYEKSLKNPMPFYLGTPTVVGSSLAFDWDEAYDFNGQDVTYTFQVSTDMDFKDAKKFVAQAKLTNVNNFQMLKLKPGTYYWRVTAENTSGYTQIAFDAIRGADGHRRDGEKSFQVTPAGQIVEGPGA